MCNLPSTNKVYNCHEITITCYDDFFDNLRLFNKEKWFFRGHSHIDWKLATSFERFFGIKNAKDAQILEWSTIQTFKKDAIRYFDYGEAIEWLSTMQHFGAPTRLLDFTESIMVALYFSLENVASNENACIWAIRQDVIWNNQDYFQHERFNENDDPFDIISTEMFVKNNIYERNNQALQFANKLIHNESPLTSANDVQDENFKGVIPIYPQISNERLSAQNGLFLMPRDLSSKFEDNLLSLLNHKKYDINPNMDTILKKQYAEKYDFDGNPMVKIIYPVSFLKNEGIKILENANITPKTLFPGMTGIGKSIKFFPFL